LVEKGKKRGFENCVSSCIEAKAMRAPVSTAGKSQQIAGATIALPAMLREKIDGQA